MQNTRQTGLIRLLDLHVPCNLTRSSIRSTGCDLWPAQSAAFRYFLLLLLLLLLAPRNTLHSVCRLTALLGDISFWRNLESPDSGNIMRPLKNPKVHYRGHSCSQMNPVHTLKPYFSNIHFVLSSRSCLPNHSFFQGFHKNFVCSSSFTMCTVCSTHLAVSDFVCSENFACSKGRITGVAAQSENIHILEVDTNYLFANLK